MVIDRLLALFNVNICVYTDMYISVYTLVKVVLFHGYEIYDVVEYFPVS